VADLAGERWRIFRRGGENAARLARHRCARTKQPKPGKSSRTEHVASLRGGLAVHNSQRTGRRAGGSACLAQAGLEARWAGLASCPENPSACIVCKLVPGTGVTTYGDGAEK
jgi:hypothetical protein